METMMIQGKVETIYDNRDFARMLYEKLGSDAENYFLQQTDPDTVLDDLDLTDDEILLKWCSGECDKVQSTQEHYQSILTEIKALADAVYQKILEGYQIGGKRTKKEQFALDKVIEIHNIVNKNT